MGKLALGLTLLVSTLFPTKSLGSFIPYMPPKAWSPQLPPKYNHLPDIKTDDKTREERTFTRKRETSEYIVYEIYTWEQVGDLPSKRSYQRIRIPKNRKKRGFELLPPHSGPLPSERNVETPFPDLLNPYLPEPQIPDEDSGSLSNPGIRKR